MSWDKDMEAPSIISYLWPEKSLLWTILYQMSRRLSIGRKKIVLAMNERIKTKIAKPVFYKRWRNYLENMEN